jgi:hypothetical protein
MKHMREKWGLTILSQGAGPLVQALPIPAPVDRTVCPHFSPYATTFTQTGAQWRKNES